MPPESHPDAVEEHRSFLRALARELLADEHAAEDVVQETAIAWWARPPRSTEAARTWLARVARNFALNRRRERERRDAREEFAARGERLPSHAEIDASLEVQRRVLAAVLALREPYKTVVWLRWYEDLPPRAIARRTGRTVETVKSQLKRALTDLRVDLDHDFGDRQAWGLALLPLLRTARAPLAVAATVAAVVLFCTGLAFVAWSNRASRTDPERANAALLAAAGLPEGVGAAVESHPAILEHDAPSVRVPAASPTAFRGRALDAHDGAPLPELDFVLSFTDGSSTSGRTALDGTFETGVPPGAQLANAEFREEEPVHIARERVDEFGTAEFELAIGPTFALDLTAAPAAASELSASLALPGARDHGVAARVRAGSLSIRPWVRFSCAPELSLFSAGERSMYVLTVASPDGLSRAIARVHARAGTHRRLVPLAFEPCGRVRGRIPALTFVTESGASAALTSDADRVERRTKIAKDGTFEFGLVPPGPARIAVRSSVLDDVEVDVHVLADGPTDVELAPDLRPLAHAWIGLRSSTTSHPLPGAPRFRRRGASEWRDAVERGSVTAPGCERLVHFRMEAAEYEVVPPACEGVAWKPAFATLGPSHASASFVLLDAAPTERVHFRATTTDGAPIDRFRAHVLIDRLGRGRAAAVELDGGGFVREGRLGAATFERVPRDARGWWLVEANGCQSAWGELSELPRDRNGSTAAVELLTAWKCALEFVGRDSDGSERRLRGVRVSTKGGRLLATSLGDGRAELELLYDPGTLLVDLDGWRVTQWDGFAGGKRRAELDLHHVELERSR